jgi:hypothetical protein
MIMKKMNNENTENENTDIDIVNSVLFYQSANPIDLK